MKNIIYLILMFLAIPMFAQNWPGWRGATGDGLVPDSKLPAQWSSDENIAWRLPMPGPAASTPVVWDNRIFLTSVENGNLILMAISTEGKELWKKTVDQGNKEFLQGESNYAAPSPSTDGKFVYALFGSGKLVNYSVDGILQWERNLAEEYGEFNLYFGMASSPLLHNGVLYIQLIHTDARLVLAIDSGTGKNAWKHDRVTKARNENLHSYASPTLFKNAKTTQLIIHGSDVVTGHNLTDGTEIWRSAGLQDPDNYNDVLRLVATPVNNGEILIVPSAKNGPVLALNPTTAKGNITGNKANNVWRWNSGTTDVPSAVIHNGLVYMCRENGVLYCIDAATGEEVYKASVYRKRHRSSLVFGDNKIYITSMDGTVSVVRAGREYKLLSQNKFNEHTAASPAVHNGVIYFRTYRALYAVSDTTE
ncbi:MAG: PQQ-binding-like beta-propeller repeat protein [Calditrichia bacterium]